MIKINLLPPELQRAASLPKLVFYTLSGSTVAVMLVGIAALWTWIDTGNMKRNLDNRRTEVASIESQASLLDRINEDIAYYKERERAIIQIKTRRILWASKLDQKGLPGTKLFKAYMAKMRAANQPILRQWDKE